ncbi:unnamed protein product [Moneuplotes crassus]|uniref:Uncharacterized protein n=1 Tax=Euplotes crassus TaxID=5936 RepID=A0AAD1Y909_EUPCR|nr:unnamed protein product [Moneuplotes crassus]
MNCIIIIRKSKNMSSIVKLLQQSVNSLYHYYNGVCFQLSLYLMNGQLEISLTQFSHYFYL